eukprot:gene383-6797_t
MTKYLKSSLLSEVRNLIQDKDFSDDSDSDSEKETEIEIKVTNLHNITKLDMTKIQKFDHEIKKVQNVNTPGFFIRPDRHDTNYRNYMNRTIYKKTNKTIEKSMEIIADDYTVLSINEDITEKPKTTRRVGNISFENDDDELINGRLTTPRSTGTPTSARGTPTSARSTLNSARGGSPMFKVKKNSLLEKTDQKTVDSIFELFEHDFPLVDLKKFLNLDIESPDLLLKTMDIGTLKNDERRTFSFYIDFLEFPELMEFDKYTEQLFGSATIYEKDENNIIKRLSETFNFIVSNEKMSSLFTLDTIPKECFILLKFSRTYKGELNEFVTEMYKKQPKMKQFEKNEIGIEGFNKLMNNFKTSFCYTLIRLDLLLLMKSTFITQLNLIKKNQTDELLIEQYLLNENLKNKIEKSIIPCKLQIMTFEKKYLNPRNYLFSLVIVDSQRPLYSREMEWFNQKNIESTLNLKNCFFIYPKHFICPYSNKYIQLEISISNEESIFYDPIAGNLVNKLTSEVLSSSKNMNFNDEFKAIIPSNLSQKHHLIFRFFKVTSIAEKLNPKESSKRSLFAMGTSKIFDGKHIIKEKEITIFNVDDSQKHNSLKKLSGNEKKNFSFEIKVLSNNFEQDENLSNFFDILNHSTIENDVKLSSKLNCSNDTILEILKKLPFSSIGSKFPIVIDFLMELIITNENEEIKLKSFYCLMTLVQSFQKNDNLNHRQLVSYYTKYIFKFSEINSILPYLIIYLNDSNKPKEIYFEIYWFIFSIILKSIGILKLKTEIFKNDVIVELKLNLEKIIENLMEQIITFIQSDFKSIQILIFEISYFLRILSIIFEKEFTNQIILKFLNQFSKLKEEILFIKEEGNENSIISPIFVLELSFFLELLKNPDFLSSNISQHFQKFISFGFTSNNVLYRYQTIILIRKLFLTISKNKFKGIQIMIHQQFLETLFKVLFEWTEIVEEKVENLKKIIENLEKEIENDIEKYTNDRTNQNIDSNLRLVENNDFFEELNFLLKEKRDSLYSLKNVHLRESIIARNEKEFIFSCFFESLNFIDFSKKKEKSFLTQILFCLKISIEFLEYEGKEKIIKMNEIVDEYLNEIFNEQEESMNNDGLNVGMDMDMGISNGESRTNNPMNLIGDYENYDLSKRIMLIIFENVNLNQNVKSSKKFFSKSFSSIMMKRKSFGTVKEKTFEDRVKNKMKFQKQLSHNVGLITISTLKKILNENEELISNNTILREEIFEILMNLCRFNYSEFVKISSLSLLNDLFEKFENLTKQLKRIMIVIQNI